jgi:hypothetical protein
VTSSGKISPGFQEGLSQLAQRTEVYDQVFVGQVKGLLQLIHPIIEPQQRETESLDLLVGKAATIHSADGLMFKDAAQQFYHGKYKPRKALLDLVRVGVYPFRERIGESNKIAN